MSPSELRIGNYLGYKVREDGVIFSKQSGNPLKYRLNDKGYPSVVLYYEGKSVFRRVHRIVAIVFIPNPQNKPCVNHKDRNRQNFNVNNLEWVTYSENVKHSVKNGGRKNWTRNNKGNNNPKAKLTWEKVCAIRDLYENNGYSQNELSRIFDVPQGEISLIVNFKKWESAS